MRRKLAAGNWKMNGCRADLAEVGAIAAACADQPCDVLLCLPATLVYPAAELGAAPLLIGAQDCHAADSGAHTGDVSALQLADAGAVAVIVGHSERRADHGETSAQVRAKAEAARAAGLIAIICLGETHDERDSGRTLEVIGAQLADSVPDAATAAQVVIAYEPVWAIGSGQSATPEQIAQVHGYLRQALVARFGDPAGQGFRLLYGGSVKPDNAAEIFAIADVDGALVGGASLTAQDFGPIVTALAAS